MAQENWDKLFDQLKELTKDMPTPILTARQPPPPPGCSRIVPDDRDIIVIDYTSTLRPIDGKR